MSVWRQVTYGIWNLLHRSKRDQDLTEEIDQYYEEAAADWKARGWSAEEAARAARREAGNPAAEKERARSYGWENSVRSALGDLRFAVRQLRKHPVFTMTATLTLALGIGANAAIFTVIQSVLLAPLPYANADRLVILQTHWTDKGKTIPRVTGLDTTDIREQSRSLEAVSLYYGGNLGVQLRNHSAYATVAFVDENFARVFSLQPVAGRLFTDGEAHRAALVSEQFARDNFGSTRAALGQVLHIEGEPLEITGVLPSKFDFPNKTQVWEARPLHEPQWEARSSFNYKAVALLRSGMSIGATQTELAGISRRLEAAYPVDNRKKELLIQPLQEALTGETRPTLLFLWATVALILLIACANVMHLQLVRAMERQRELAIRRALGSSRIRVMRPVFIEGLLISFLGGLAGVLLAFPAVRVLVAMAPKELPRSADIHLNGWVFAFTLALCVATALFSSMLPALRAARVDPAEALKHDASRGINKRGTSTLRKGLVVAEVAATFVLAMGAGLLLHTMTALMNRDLGFESRQLLVVDADAPAHTDPEMHKAVRQFDRLFAQLSAMPGILHVGGIMGLPAGAYGSNGSYWIKDGPSTDPGHEPWSLFSVASPGYFQTMGIPIKRGRDFNSRDTYESPFVAVISESLAKQAFGDTDPIGKQLRCGLDAPDQWMTVVGVVGDVRQDSPAEKPGPNLYMPMAQHPFYANQIHIVLRTGVKPLTLLNAVQEKIAEANPLIATRYTTMDAMVNRSMAAERFRAVLVSTFAGVGLALAMLGVYGTMAYSVTQRTFEIGVRMAFGAEKSAIVGDVLATAAKLTCFGIGAGLVLGQVLVRLVTSMLEGVRPSDPVSIAGAAVLLLATALLAGFAPAWRAARVNPMVALRAE